MPTPVILPKLEMSQESATLIEWLKQEGEVVQKGEPLFVVETDKVTVEVDSPESGVLGAVSAFPGETLPVTTVIAQILQPGEKLPQPEVAGQSNGGSEKKAAPPTPISPLAARMAVREGLDMSTIAGSGPGGKIVRADVELALNKVRASPAARRIAKETGVALAQVVGSGPRGRIQGADVLAQRTTPPEPQATEEYTIIPVEGMRRRIAERMLASYQEAPHITFSTRINLEGLSLLRGELNQRAEQAGEVRVSLTALFVRLVGFVLTRHPYLNARLVETGAGDEIHLMKQVNVGMAVALPEGLIVPVIHAADRRPLREIAKEVQDLAEKARSGQLTLADVAGGTFTISNLGPFGIEQFTAILNPGQVGILAVGAGVPEAVVVAGQVQVREVVHLTLSVDHRVVDGAVAAHFMADLKAVLENPSLALW
jgi:pyruvate dehydrogenase E2 component (dihydrolipoamide acetyltransferase)